MCGEGARKARQEKLLYCEENKENVAIRFTEKQQKILNARNHNILVSAAAGSGKTAVLVERIVRMISEGETPMDIDRLLVVTFTRAAASQMRERIARAVSLRLEEHPEDRHLQRQETLLHNAQITTIDSFCTFLLRNNFSEINLDPGFRQMDDTESPLLEKDVMKRFLEEQYSSGNKEFLACTEYFCPGRSDEGLEALIQTLYRAADSHPYPEVWLEERKDDYHVESTKELYASAWYQSVLMEESRALSELAMLHQAMLRITRLPDGPFPYQDLLEREEGELFGKLDALEKETEQENDMEKLRKRLLCVVSYPLERLPVIRGAGKQGISETKKEEVQELRTQLKKRMQSLAENISEEPAVTVQRMQQAEGPVRTLLNLTLGYRRLLQEVKKERNVIDFSDLEHMALDILVERKEDGSLVLRKAAEGYRKYFDEILIDEYQDSNEVQELLLSAIAGERGAGFSGKTQGRYARFMVGDVKQSIYRFRNARPEIFEEKYETYHEDDKETERIDLDQNFRSRREVLDAANAVFTKIMRREIGGVEYDERVSLKLGAGYPEPGAPASEACKEHEAKEDPEESADRERPDPYQTELLLVDGSRREDASGNTEQEENAGQKEDHASTEDAGEEEDPVAALSSARKEALAVAQRIRELVGTLPVTDEETGKLRPARYGDIVILLRSTSGRQDAFREVFEKEGIPLYLEYKGGYFSAEEIRTVLQALRVIDNPRQDIPLYGVLRGYFGGFTQDEIGSLRGIFLDDGEKLLYDCVLAAAEGEGAQDPALASHCREFLAWLGNFRVKMATTPIHELIGELIRSTGYEDYVRALPAGARRAANLHSLLVKAGVFEQGDYAGLFRFLRYIDQMHEFDVDYGEASVLDEHADVVRLTTIHKSKGLEYPVCFVCGLGGRHPFSRDLTGSLIVDTDLGLGVSLVVPRLRSSLPTLRQKIVAAKIARDALGEELRVLYVAMTRAKEKLILTGFVRDAERTGKKVQTAMAAVCLPAKHLPVSMIRSSSGYLPLLLKSMEALKAEGKEPILLKRVSVSDLRLSELENRAAQGELLRSLQLMENGGILALPDTALAGELEKKFSYRYPYENLRGLYTKTTVTELKRASMLTESEVTSPGEGAVEWQPAGKKKGTDADFGENPIQADELPVPRFAKEGELSDIGCTGADTPADAFRQNAFADVASAKHKNAALSASARGTAIHRMCEKIDYHVWTVPSLVTAKEFENRVEQLTGAGAIPKEYASALTPERFLPFLRSKTAARMAQAEQRHELRREQPFVLGIPANRLDTDFPANETILIQGIMDAFFLEGEGESQHAVVVDYKTDRVKRMEELADRYRVQLDYYAEALSKMLQLPVTERILYSFHLQKEISI